MSAQIPKILAIGGATQDVFFENSREFRPVKVDSTHELIDLKLGSKIDVNQIHYATGGGATNAAVTFARQGLNASFFGVIGDDLAGQQVLQDLEREFVDTSRVETSEIRKTDYSTIILAPNGERTILTYRGASTQIFADNLAFRPHEFDWIYVSNLAGRMDTLDQIFSQARANDIKIMWNPGKNELAKFEETISLLEDVDVLLVNKEEAQILFGEFEPEELLLRAKNRVKVAIITDGPNGVWATDGATMVRAGMYEDTPSVDRTGAGDAFGSGFLSQWAQGSALKPALLFASANSTSVIQHFGAKEGILRKNQILDLHSMPMYEKRIDV
ncbi:MAG: carbohydrate kinase family protein [bacterium]|nr:carbohydrate kinase family protein [bacterium]